MKVTCVLSILISMMFSQNSHAATADQLVEDVRRFQTQMADDLTTALTPSEGWVGWSEEVARVREVFIEKLRSETEVAASRRWWPKLGKRTAHEVKILADQLVEVLAHPGPDRGERAVDILVQLHLMMARIPGDEARYALGAEDQILAGLRVFVLPAWAVLIHASPRELTLEQWYLMYSLVWMPAYVSSAIWALLEMDKWDQRPSRRPIEDVAEARRATARHLFESFWSRVSQKWTNTADGAGSVESKIRVDIRAFDHLGLRGQGLSAACDRWLTENGAAPRVAPTR